ncbi:MAG TPA: efflux RND transporter periplasmic adaptor subunit [Xanthobacteraceae bacterium]|nr:efflux RND transporter periplasmic adaptor subunit [Xanthobacteraceae bacterium]
MRFKPIAIALIGLAVVAAAVAYWPSATPTQQQGKGFGKGKKGGGQQTSADPVPVRATVAQRADVPVYLDGVGTARALNTVLVKPQVEGKLIAVSFTEGQDVPRGYVLAKIDPTTYQALYDQAVATKAQHEAQAANARLDLERYMRLAATNAINKQQVDTQRAMVAQLEAQVNADQAAIDNARAILSYTEITAPIAGRTGIRQVDEGNIVRPSDTTGLVTITEIKPISVLFNLPQQSLPELHRGMAEGPLVIDAMGPDGRTPVDTGKVQVIDNQVDPTTGTVRIKGEFPNANLQLWPGQFVNVRLLIDTLKQVVVVPTSAVQRGPTGTFVFIIGEDSTVAMRRVTISRQDDVRAVVADGLTAGERLVTSGFARLADKALVEVTATEEVGQPPAMPTVDTQPRGKGRGAKGKGGADKGGEKGKTQGAGAQGTTGAKPSATP